MFYYDFSYFCPSVIGVVSFSSATNGQQEDVAKVWTLSTSDLMDDDVDLMDQDELLDAEDFVKPDPASLKGKILDLHLGHVLILFCKFSQPTADRGRSEHARTARVA